MKSNLFFQVLFLVAVLATSCQKESIELSDNSILNNLSDNSNIIPAVAAEFTMEQYQQIIAADEARLARVDNQTSRGTMQSITVPDDFATIQEAVDAASEGANIFVNAGTYTEDVTISTAGLKLQARKDVQLDGSFTLVEGGDNVTIKKFSIDNPGTAIHGFGITGGQIVQNTITAAIEGVHFISCDGSTVRDNIITGSDWAILFSTFSGLGEGTCNNNTISNNAMSGNAAVGIQVQGNCQYNTVSNNTINEGAEIGNGGVFIFGVPDYIGAPIEFQGECNNNVVKNNNCTQGFAGIGVVFNAYNNTIGPNNTTNENYVNGIWLYSGASDNNIFNNTALNNVDCDIVIQDGDFPPFVPCVGNTLSNNTYDCFTEL